MTKKEFPSVIQVVSVDNEGYYTGMIDAHISPLQAEEGVYNYPAGTAFDSKGGVVKPPKGFKKNQVARFIEDVWVFEDIQVDPVVVQENKEYVCVETSLTAEEIAVNTRNKLLKDSDYVVMVAYERGVKVPREWVVYRQMLRDLTNQQGYPTNIQWPVKPSDSI